MRAHMGTSGEPLVPVEEADVGTVHRDRHDGVWLVEVAPKGLLLYFEDQEFRAFASLLCKALMHTAGWRPTPRVRKRRGAG